MVAAVSGTAKPTARPGNTTRRLPLLPSEKDNADGSGAGGAPARRPRAREVTSRYMSYISSPASSSSSSSTTASSTPTPKRCPSPLVARASPDLPAQKRAQSAERQRRSVPGTADVAGGCPAAKALWASSATTTRSFSVSFQGQSFSLPVKKPVPCPTPERQRPSPARSRDVESSRLLLEQHHRWPAKSRSSSGMVSRNLDHFALEKIAASAMGGPVSPIRASMDSGAEVSTSDTDSVSSGSNSGISDSTAGRSSSNGFVGRMVPKGLTVPARFWPENNTRLRRAHDLLPSPKKGSGSAKKLLPDSPKSQSSPLQAAPSPRGAQPSPTRSRPSPSLINFAAEVRRGKMGEARVEHAHSLRLLHNRHLQWRLANARVNAALSIQHQTAVRHLYTSWLATSELRDLVAMKRMRLQSQRLNLKLTSILVEQMSYLENWALIESDNSSSLTRVIRDLRASTLRLPVTEGAQGDVLKVKDAISSAMDVMQVMATSISYMVAKVARTNSFTTNLANISKREQALLVKCKDALSRISAMQVEEASLRAHLLQLKPASYLTQL